MNFASLPKKNVFLLLGLPFVLLALLVSPALVQQETRYCRKAVSSSIYYMAQNHPQGYSDADNGSEAHAWCTFQKTSNFMVARDATYAPGAVIIIDNNDPGFTSTGYWHESSGPYPYGTNSLWSDVWKDPVDNAAWTPAIATPGSYSVYAWWTSNTGWVADASYTINYDGGQTTIKVNQRMNGGQWNLLGTFSFASGTTGNVTLHAISEDTESGGNSVCADAIKFEYLSPFSPYMIYLPIILKKWCGNSVCADAVKFEYVNPSTTWTLPDFDGQKMDYAYWLREGFGEYNINDDDRKVRGLVNNALLYLAFGDDEPAYDDPSKTAKQAYHDQFINLYNTGYSWPDNGDRQLADALDSYIFMRDAGVFTLSEQQMLEEWFRDLDPDPTSRQYVRHALFALVGYVLSTTNTGIDYSDVVQQKWDYANQALSFDETFGPIENSAHYSCYILKSMLRIDLFTDDGHVNKNNLKKAVQRILDVYPHNGFTLSFGQTWFYDYVRPLHDFLLGAAYVLDDGNPENVEVAKNAKWLAAEMFRYGFDHAKVTIEGSDDSRGRFETNPMWAWRYAKDSLSAQKPSVAEHGSKAAYGDMGHSYDQTMSHKIKLDKVVHRDGWEDNSFYLLLDIVPQGHIGSPYANSIVNFVYGDEPFSSGKTRDRYNTEWEKRNVIYPHEGSNWDAELKFIHNFNDYSTSKAREGKWDRYVGFVKDNSYAVVFDFAPSSGTAYWHLVSQPSPEWHSDWVELTRGDYKSNVYYPNNLGWYSINHYDSYEKGSHGRYLWYVDSPSRELELENAKTWATVLYPYRGESPNVSAINPTQNGSGIYPSAVGVKLVHATYTDWNGASSTTGLVTYDNVKTDAEIFWARATSCGNKWTISFVNGSRIEIPASASPSEVLFNDTPISNWSYSSGTLTITPPDNKGTIKVSITATSTSTPTATATATSSPMPTATPSPTARPTATSAPGTEIIIDNSDPGFTSTGYWHESSGPNPYGTNSLWSDVWEDPVDSATWTPAIATPGNYSVYAWWTSNTGRVTDAPYTINYNGGQTTIKVNQRMSGGQWNPLGTFSFALGTTRNVTLHAVSEDTESGGNSICADAIRFQYAGVYTMYLPIIWKNW